MVWCTSVSPRFDNLSVYLLPVPKPDDSSKRPVLPDGFPATRFSTSDAVDFYVKNGPGIFHRSYRSWALALWSKVRNYTSPLYSSEYLKSLIHANAGNEWLSDLIKVRMITYTQYDYWHITLDNNVSWICEYCICKSTYWCGWRSGYHLPLYSYITPWVKHVTASNADNSYFYMLVSCCLAVFTV